jgi:hypothetical protein
LRSDRRWPWSVKQAPHPDVLSHATIQLPSVTQPSRYQQPNRTGRSMRQPSPAEALVRSRGARHLVIAWTGSRSLPVRSKASSRTVLRAWAGCQGRADRTAAGRGLRELRAHDQRERAGECEEDHRGDQVAPSHALVQGIANLRRRKLSEGLPLGRRDERAAFSAGNITSVCTRPITELRVSSSRPPSAAAVTFRR